MTFYMLIICKWEKALTDGSQGCKKHLMIPTDDRESKIKIGCFNLKSLIKIQNPQDNSEVQPPHPSSIHGFPPKPPYNDTAMKCMSPTTSPLAPDSAPTFSRPQSENDRERQTQCANVDDTSRRDPLPADAPQTRTQPDDKTPETPTIQTMVGLKSYNWPKPNHNMSTISSTPLGLPRQNLKSISTLTPSHGQTIT